LLPEQVAAQVVDPLVRRQADTIEPRGHVGGGNEVAIVAVGGRRFVDRLVRRRRGVDVGARGAREPLGQTALERGPLAARHGGEHDVDPREIAADDREGAPVPERVGHGRRYDTPLHST